jgi:hypothetical protein
MSEEYRELSQEFISDREDQEILSALEDADLSLSEIGQILEEIDTELGYYSEDVSLTDRIAQAVERLVEKGEIEMRGTIIKKIN